MSSPSVQVLGAHRINVREALVSQALEWKYSGVLDSDEQRRSAREHVLAELNNVVLVEVFISNRDDQFDMSGFGQGGSDQAPYGEVFLSEDGTEVIASGYEVPQHSSLRIAFYLHFLDPAKPLATSYGPAQLPPIGLLPERLEALVPYEPVT